MTWRRLAVLAAAALGAGWLLGWFVLGPLLGLFLLPVPGGTPPPVVSAAPASPARQHLASLSPVSAVPVQGVQGGQVPHHPPPARPRHHATPTPASTVKIPPTPAPTPTPIVTPSVLPTDTPTEPTDTPTAETPPGSP